MLADGINEGKKPDMNKIKEFHDKVLEGYIEVMSGERPVLFKMKEIWSYMIVLFEDAKEYAKKIRKAEKISVYREVVDELFDRDIDF